MELKVIKNKKEYQAYMKELDALMDLKPKSGTPKGNRLEVLSLLLENYEKSEFPMDLPDPIEAIKFRMEQQNLKQRDLIPYIGSASKVSEVLNGKRTLSLNMIRALHEHLYIPAEVLMRAKSAKIPEKSGIDWNRFPFKKMYDKGWLRNAPSTWVQARDMAEELIRPFWERFITRCPTALLTRRTMSKRADKNIDIFSCAAWAARVVDRTMDIKLSNSYKLMNANIMEELARMSIHYDGPRLATGFLYQHGIHLIIEPHLPNTFIDGAAIMLKDGTPVLSLTLRYDRVDYFWHSLMHELSHLKLHMKSGCEPFLDDFDQDFNLDKREQEADLLAQKILVPDIVWQTNKDLKYLSEDQVVEISRKIQRHPAIVAGQVQLRLRDYIKFGLFVKRHKVRQLFPEFQGN